MTAHIDDATASSYGVRTVTQLTQVTAKMLERLARYVNKGTIKPQVDAVFPIDEVKEAFEARESGRVNGKVALKIK